MLRRAVSEVCLLQRSARTEEKRKAAWRVTQQLAPLASAEERLMLAPEAPRSRAQFNWSIDALPCAAINTCSFGALWQTSLLAHLSATLGAARQLGPANTPPGVRPFAQLMCVPGGDIEGLLERTYWPGLPNDEWHAWQYAGPQGYKMTGSFAVVECACGYRYPLGECMRPMQSAKCRNPDIDCPRTNGGSNHIFSDDQTRVATLSRGQKSTTSNPGLFALTEAENIRILQRGNYDEATEASAATSVRDLDQLTFRALHWLVHSSALLAVGADPSLGAGLQRHIRDLAKVRPVKDHDSLLWYLKASADADLKAIALHLKSSRDDAARILHALLHRLGDQALPRDQLGHAWRLQSSDHQQAYEAWFGQNVVQPVLRQRNDSPQAFIAITATDAPEGRRPSGEADQAEYEDVSSSVFLERRCLREKQWSSHVPSAVRAQLLPHILRCVQEPDVGRAYDELQEHDVDDLQVRMACRF